MALQTSDTDFSTAPSLFHSASEKERRGKKGKPDEVASLYVADADWTPQSIQTTLEVLEWRGDA